MEALHGILDFLEPRFKGPVIIAESSAGFTTEGYDHFGYTKLVPEHKPLQVSLVDLNEEGKYLTHPILDGWAGIEGNGPGDGQLVPSRCAIASTDYDAADRVGVEVMGLNADWVGYRGFCAQLGLGQDNLAKIEIRGAKLPDVTKKYRMHDDIERELRWQGPLKEIPEKLG